MLPDINIFLITSKNYHKSQLFIKLHHPYIIYIYKTKVQRGGGQPVSALYNIPYHIKVKSNLFMPCNVITFSRPLLLLYKQDHVFIYESIYLRCPTFYIIGLLSIVGNCFHRCFVPVIKPNLQFTHSKKRDFRFSEVASREGEMK